MRARTFWIALPLAIVLALWLGSGLAVEDEMPLPPVPEPALEPVRDTLPAEDAALLEPECEAPHDPGPDGDR